MVGRLARVAAWALVAVLVVGVAGWVGLTRVLPHYRPALQDGERYAIDVSAHQGEIDWRAVAADDVSAAYLKASEGATFADDHFAANWRAAREAGLEVGAYHFFTLCRSGSEQAANLVGRLREVGADASSLPPVVDLELSGNCSSRPAVEQVQRELRAFVSAVEDATGQRVTVYLLGSFADHYPLPDDLVDRERWVRRLLLRPGEEWRCWQVSSRASVDGVDGPVDLDVLRAG